MDSSGKTVSTSSSKGALDFFMTVGKLKHLRRTGWINNKVPDCESVAGHMYRMSVMAFFLGRQETSALDRDRCIKMALIHDLAESVVGDLTPFCGVSKDEKQKLEQEALLGICASIDEDTKQEIYALFEEYEKQKTPEAKAVKDLDKFDMILQAYEYEKKMETPLSLQSFFNSTEGLFSNHEIMKWIEQLKRIRQPDLTSEEQNKDT